MNLFYRLILALIFCLGISVNSFAIENKILFKVNNEIITSVDILNEIKYLNLLNKNLKNFDKNKIYEVAKNSIIKNKIKENELRKFYKELDVDKKYLNEITIKYFDKLDLNSIEELKILLQKIILIGRNSKKLLFKFYGIT